VSVGGGGVGGPMRGGGMGGVKSAAGFGVVGGCRCFACGWVVGVVGRFSVLGGAFARRWGGWVWGACGAPHGGVGDRAGAALYVVESAGAWRAQRERLCAWVGTKGARAMGLVGLCSGCSRVWGPAGAGSGGVVARGGVGVGEAPGRP